MDAHDKTRELLGLAVAGALSAEEEKRVEGHAASCAACAADLENWRSLAGGLRRLPTPQPGRLVVERARARAAITLAEQIENRGQRRTMILLLAFAWVVTLATWPLFRIFTGGLLVWFDPRFNQTWLVFAAFTGLIWATGGLAAVLLGRHRQQERRIA